MGSRGAIGVVRWVGFEGGYVMEIVIVSLFHGSSVHFTPILSMLICSPNMSRLKSTISTNLSPKPRNAIS